MTTLRKVGEKFSTDIAKLPLSLMWQLIIIEQYADTPINELSDQCYKLIHSEFEQHGDKISKRDEILAEIQNEYKKEIQSPFGFFNRRSSEAKQTPKEAYVLTVDFTVDAEGRVTVYELGDHTSNHDNFGKAYPGEHLKLLYLRDLSRHYKSIFLLEGAGDANSQSLINHRLLQKAGNVKVGSHADLMLFAKECKNSPNKPLAISLSYDDHITLNQYFLDKKLNVPVVNGNPCIHACTGSKAIFYKKISSTSAPVPIPLTFVAEEKMEKGMLDSFLNKIKDDYVFIKPTHASMSIGAFPFPKNRVGELLELLFDEVKKNNISSFRKRIEALYDKDICAKLEELYKFMLCYPSRLGVILQELVQPERIDGHTYTAKALYNIYVDEDGSIRPVLIGNPYVELAKEKQIGDKPTVASTIAEDAHPQPFPAKHLKTANEQLTTALITIIQMARKECTPSPSRELSP